MEREQETPGNFGGGRKWNFLRWPLESIKIIFQDTLGAIGLILLILFIVMAFLAPWVAPFGPFEVVYHADQSVVRLAAPNVRNWLGTTNQGMDVFSQLLHGSRIALLVGVLSAVGSVLVGTAVGLFSEIGRAHV